MEAFESIAAIGLVLALLGAVLFLLKKRGIAQFTPMAGRAKQLELIDRIALGPQHALHLVRVGGRAVLIATAPGHCAIFENTLELS
ncbi:MAG TPA: flagellar biosynthetic protein FliO [Bryobacteraceae bacterium]|nr:flagellar biosynthetic protein FliO [Bryobacteraceae bacterium]